MNIDEATNRYDQRQSETSTLPQCVRTCSGLNSRTEIPDLSHDAAMAVAGPGGPRPLSPTSPACTNDPGFFFFRPRKAIRQYICLQQKILSIQNKTESRICTLQKEFLGIGSYRHYILFIAENDIAIPQKYMAMHDYRLSTEKIRNPVI